MSVLTDFWFYFGLLIVLSIITGSYYSGKQLLTSVFTFPTVTMDDEEFERSLK